MCKKTMRIYEFGLDKLFTKLSEEGKFYIFQADYKVWNEDNKNSSFYFAETVLIKIAHRGTIYESFGHSIEKWKLPFTVMEAFTNRI